MIPFSKRWKQWSGALPKASGRWALTVPGLMAGPGHLQAGEDVAKHIGADHVRGGHDVRGMERHLPSLGTARDGVGVKGSLLVEDSEAAGGEIRVSSEDGVESLDHPVLRRCERFGPFTEMWDTVDLECIVLPQALEHCGSALGLLFEQVGFLRGVFV